MPVPTTNVTFSSIQTEFGGANPVNMSEYYRGGARVPAGTATSGTDGTAISTSGLIRVGMFRGTSQTPANTPNNSYEVWYQRFGVSFATATFATNGVVTATGQGTQTVDSTPDWYTPVTTSIGNGYWIRFVETSASGNGAQVSGDALNTWHQLNISRSRTASTGSAAEAYYTYSYQISTSSSGTPVVASGSISLGALNSQF